MKIEGFVHKYGDNVDTDVILPARYIVLSDPKKLAEHCMEDIDRDFAIKVRPGDVIVAGKNFGCGSSREHAPIALKAAGVTCVIAKSFARIFFRNAINIGLPIMECYEAVEGISAGNKVYIDFKAGIIEDMTTGKRYNVEPFPAFIQKIVEAEGLLNYNKF